MFKGYFLSFKNNDNNTKLCEHLLQNGNLFGKINYIMKILSLPKGNTFGYRGESLYLQRIIYRKLSQE